MTLILRGVKRSERWMIAFGRGIGVHDSGIERDNRYKMGTVVWLLVTIEV